MTDAQAEERNMSTAIFDDGVGGDPQIGAPYATDIDVGWRSDFTKMTCKQPPDGGIRAIDLATGDTLWIRPLGSARANGPFNIPSRLPLTTGTPNNGGPVVTAGRLLFIAATTDNLIRALDLQTGEELWSDVLPAGGQATPIVYEVEGIQHVAITAGGAYADGNRLGRCGGRMGAVGCRGAGYVDDRRFRGALMQDVTRLKIAGISRPAACGAIPNRSTAAE